MDSVSRALWLAAQTLEIRYYSPPGDAKLTLVTSKMSSLFAAVTNEEISQIIEEAIPNKQEEGDKTQFRSFYTCLFNLNLSIKPVKKFYV